MTTHDDRLNDDIAAQHRRELARFVSGTCDIATTQGMLTLHRDCRMFACECRCHSEEYLGEAVRRGFFPDYAMDDRD